MNDGPRLVDVVQCFNLIMMIIHGNSALCSSWNSSLLRYLFALSCLGLRLLRVEKANEKENKKTRQARPLQGKMS